MKQIILKSEELVEENVPLHTPVFAKKGGKLAGMFVREQEGWILRIGGGFGCSGHHPTRKDCMESVLIHEYTFFIED
jgi:hypothetical protein